MLALWPSRAVALSAFGFELRWYGVLYVLAFGLAWWLLPRLQRYRGLNLARDEWLSALTWSAAGVLIGGRVGYVLFYEPAYFSARPGQIFALWQGGMSAHGGFIGVGLALWFFARRLKIDVLKLADVIVVPVALGLALGRVGNWINAELYVSNMAHALAIGKGLVIAGACYFYLKKVSEVGGGYVLAIFLVLYGGLRFLTEYLRVQDWPLVLGLTRGQLLTLPILAAGVLLMVWLRRSKSAS